MYEVRTIAGSGRGCVALRDVSPGEIVHREEPYVMTPIVNKSAASVAACIACLRQFPSAEPHPRCDACGAHYCSTTCLGMYATLGHLQWNECDALRIAREKRGELSVDDFNHLQAMVLLAVRAKKEGAADALDEPAPRFRPKVAPEVDMVSPKIAQLPPIVGTDDVASRLAGGLFCDDTVVTAAPLYTSSYAKSVAVLTANMSRFEQDQIEIFESISQAYDALQEAYEDELPPMSTHMFVKISCAYQCNGFSFWENDQRKAEEHEGHGGDAASSSRRDREIASGFFGYAAMMNHSCAPNLVKAFVGRELQYVAIRPIKHGEEMFLCYVDKSMSFNLRQWRLSTQYFFDCQCPRCVGEIAKAKR
jgi:hypothetical protein